VAGWSYQWICQLSWAPDSWTAPVDVMRISPQMDATMTTVDQVRSLVGSLPATGPVPLFVFDAGYDPIAIGHDLAGVRAEVLCAYATTGSSMAIHLPAQTVPSRPAGALLVTASG